MLVNASTTSLSGMWARNLFYNGDDVELVVNLPSARTRDPIQVSIDWAIDPGNFLTTPQGEDGCSPPCKGQPQLAAEHLGKVDTSIRGATGRRLFTPERLGSLARDAAAFRAMVSNVSATFSQQLPGLTDRSLLQGRYQATRTLFFNTASRG